MRVLQVCLLAIFLSSGLFAESKVHFYALLLSSSQESALHQPYMNDLQSMKKHVQKISSQIGSVLHIKILQGAEATYCNIEKWLHALPRNSEKITFLYYVGTGIWSQKSSWPGMDLSDGVVLQKYITKKILRRHPRLVLSFFDCYDKLHAYSHKMNMIEKRDHWKNKFKHVKRLFLKTKGVVMGASALSNDLSYGVLYQGKPVGGIFSSLLFDTFKNGNRSWRWQFGVMNRRMALLREPKQKFLFFSSNKASRYNEIICKEKNL